MSDVGITETRIFEFASPEDPFVLDSGAALKRVRIAYETYGQLNKNRSNAILIFHALSGSQHAAGVNHYHNFPGDMALDRSIWTDECQVGWWDTFFGEGKSFDPGKYFIICANYIGSCYGSTGPSSFDPDTGRPYGGAFPDFTIGDICRTQIALLDHLGVDRLLAAIGGSMGGMLAMDLALRFPERIRLVAPLASGVTTSALTKMYNFEQLFALQEDPDFNRGDYYDGPRPYQGVVLARMIGHKTFVSLDVLEQRARNYIAQEVDDLKGYRMRHQLESYILHKGKTFAKRFDANSYVKILTAWQDFDLAKEFGDGDLVRAMRVSKEHDHRYLVVSIDSDVCFYPEEQATIVETLKACDIDYQYVTVHSDKGHDSFLIEHEHYAPFLTYILAEELARVS